MKPDISKNIQKNVQSHRQRRVGMIVRRALSAILRQQDHFIVISEVSLSRDLRHAHIFIAPSFEDDEQKQKLKIDHLVKEMPQLRRKLAGAVDLKYVPDLRFHLDPSFDHAHRMDSILSQNLF